MISASVISRAHIISSLKGGNNSMNNLYQRKSRGFTIIEVVLVLAIAGLILLMVFIALPALQRGQRDTQRRNDLSRLISQVNSYQTNTRGSVPTTQGELNSLKNDYLKASSGEFNDPRTGSAYTTTYTTAAPTAVGNISFNAARICSGTTMTTTGANARNVAAIVYLEGSGLFCQDNR